MDGEKMKEKQRGLLEMRVCKRKNGSNGFVALQPNMGTTIT